jgi:hypothetical protein
MSDATKAVNHELGAGENGAFAESATVNVVPDKLQRSPLARR